MAKEKVLLNEFMLKLSSMGHRIFRNNVGLGWIGKTSGPSRTTKTVTINPGDVIIRNARPFRSGFPKGSSDLIGWTELKITEKHLNSTLAVFTAIEVKTHNVKTTSEQSNFIKKLKSSGGIGLVARKFEDIINEFKEHL